MMSLNLRRSTAIAMGALLLGLASPAVAQEISDSHLRAARQAISAIGATEEFDAILPQAAMALTSELVQKNPDLQAMIRDTVSETAVSLAPRRADLEREAATAYARAFTEEELTAIATFYRSDAGKKLIADGPIATREMLRAADIWQQGIARDLAEQVGASLAQKTGGQANTE